MTAEASRNSNTKFKAISWGNQAKRIRFQNTSCPQSIVSSMSGPMEVTTVWYMNQWERHQLMCRKYLIHPRHVTYGGKDPLVTRPPMWLAKTILRDTLRGLVYLLNEGSCMAIYTWASYCLHLLAYSLQMKQTFDLDTNCVGLHFSGAEVSTDNAQNWSYKTDLWAHTSM